MEASTAQEKKKTKCHTATYLQNSIFIARTITKAEVMSRESYMGV